MRALHFQLLVYVLHGNNWKDEALRQVSENFIKSLIEFIHLKKISDYYLLKVIKLFLKSVLILYIVSTNFCNIKTYSSEQMQILYNLIMHN